MHVLVCEILAPNQCLLLPMLPAWSRGPPVLHKMSWMLSGQ